ncbi:hypothetical protein [uncultured Fibrobacter sp.]|uniref:hypothetical protein n=1 Tax=uncultured Fibrobacter sp. TaxID=261512 RepID=UPI00261A2E82|nr:hypothetical protein [uncultured Fibrobacter sp.]
MRQFNDKKFGLETKDSFGNFVGFVGIKVPQDSQFALLQERAKLSKFTADFLVSEAMKMSDREYELYVEKKHARAKGRAEGHAEGVVEGRQQMADFLRAKGISEEIISEALAQK